MVPYVAGRGHSFKGAGLYYLHDKGTLTSDRVAWTHTHNLPTDNPEKALRWMAFTAKSADRLKEQAGTARTGRKSTAGQVYAFSLSWHPEEKPEKEHMMSAAFETLKRLGLNEHEAVFVAHRETEHPHVHIICNLVSPKDGRTVAPAYDRLTLSTWAQEHETKNGKIYCKERVTNNRERQSQAQQNRQLALVKGKEEKHLSAEQIQDIYTRSDNGKAFQAALQEAGFTLAKGDRRGFVLVDSQGKIHSLSRQLQGQRASDLKARLSDIDERNLPDASAVADKRQRSSQDKNENKQREHTAAGNQEKRENAPEQKKEQINEQQRQEQTPAQITPSRDNFLKDLDQLRAWEQEQDRKRYRLEEELSKFYARDKLVKQIEAIGKQITQSGQSWGRGAEKVQMLENEKERLSKTLVSIDMRIAEQRGALEAQIKKNREEFFKEAKERHEPERKLKPDRGNNYHDNTGDKDHHLDR